MRSIEFSMMFGLLNCLGLSLSLVLMARYTRLDAKSAPLLKGERSYLSLSLIPWRSMLEGEKPLDLCLELKLAYLKIYIVSMLNDRFILL